VRREPRLSERVSRCAGAALALLALLLPLACGNGSAVQTEVGTSDVAFATSSAASGAPRQLATTIWYPALGGTGTAEGEVSRDAKVAPGSFPLVVFSHGTCGRPDEATYLTTALARAGFIVAAAATPGYTEDDYPGCSSPAAGADAFLNAVSDIEAVIGGMIGEASDSSSPFAGHLVQDRVAVTGVSFGGFAALLAAQQDAHLGAALALVPANSAFLGMGGGVPTMVIGSERDQIAGFAQAQLAYDKLAGPRALLELLGANHLSAIDRCSSPVLGDSCVPSDISQDEAHRLILHYAIPFLEGSLLRGESGAQPLAAPIDGVDVVASDL
jgi:predicted dienelactone hydrolase